MACDRFVYFEKGKTPSKEQVKLALVDYLGAFMTHIEWGGGRWTATLMGTKSWPLRRLVEPPPLCQCAYEAEASEKRWIEVYIAKDNIDVITRRQDEVTSNIACGFAKLVARFWQGRLELE